MIGVLIPTRESIAPRAPLKGVVLGTPTNGTGWHIPSENPEPGVIRCRHELRSEETGPKHDIMRNAQEALGMDLPATPYPRLDGVWQGGLLMRLDAYGPTLEADASTFPALTLDPKTPVMTFVVEMQDMSAHSRTQALASLPDWIFFKKPETFIFHTCS